jgi:hypothetical protein
VAEDDDERNVEEGDAELDGAEHARVDDVACGTDHEEVAESSVEDDLGSDTRVRAAEEDGEWRLAFGQAVTAGGILVGVSVLAGDEPLVASGQLGPRLGRSQWPPGRSLADPAHSPGCLPMLIAVGLLASA